MQQAAEQAGPQAGQKGSIAPGTVAAARCPDPDPSGELLSLHDLLLLVHLAYKTPEASHTTPSPGTKFKIKAVPHSSVRNPQCSMLANIAHSSFIEMVMECEI